MNELVKFVECSWEQFQKFVLKQKNEIETEKQVEEEVEAGE